MRLETEEALDRLERDIRRLKIDFERFFTGGLKTPPEQLAQSIRSQFQDLRSRRIRRFALRFRLGNLEARYNTFSVLFNRRLRALELGAGPAARAAETPAYDPAAGVVLTEQSTPQALRALYDGLYDGSEARKTSFAQFQGYLEKQAARIRSKTGCSSVQFRVASEGGKVKLKAKPLS